MKPMNDGVLVEREKIPEKKTASGLIIYHEMFESLYDKTKEDSVFGFVKEIGDNCKYLKVGDKVVWGKNMHTLEIEKKHFFKTEKNILARVNADGTYDVHPDQVMIKITKLERDKLYSKKIKRDDGKEIELFIAMPREKDAENRHEVYVQTGIVMAVGGNVKNVLKGDIAILNYTVDNNDTIIVGYDGEDKMVVIDAITTYHDKDQIAYANRRTPKDTIVACKGDYDEISSLLGVVRNDELIAREPIIFLEHKSNIVSEKTASGIQYEKEEMIYSRKILSIGEESTKKFGIKNGEYVLVAEYDVFHVKLGDKVISAINDVDIMANMNVPKMEVV